jgi:succinate dehydrogenase/fumarate reductase flavoprotein subunit
MGELGTFAGVATDEHARVITKTGTAIPGLYAAGNDMSHVMGGEYVGGGSSIGPGMTFGYIAALHLANPCSSDTTENPIPSNAERV